MTQDNGGAAFPREAYVNPHGVTIRVGSDGMTLRDYAAIKFMAALISANDGDISALGDGCAKDAFAAADAMLEARSAK